MQNVVVTVCCGTSELALSLWQDFVGKMVLKKSYKVRIVKVKSFKETNSVFTPKENIKNFGD